MFVCVCVCLYVCVCECVNASNASLCVCVCVCVCVCTCVTGGIVQNHLEDSPVWVPDSDTKTCMHCKRSEFTVINRRVGTGHRHCVLHFWSAREGGVVMEYYMLYTCCTGPGKVVELRELRVVSTLNGLSLESTLIDMC